MGWKRIRSTIRISNRQGHGIRPGNGANTSIRMRDLPEGREVRLDDRSGITKIPTEGNPASDIGIHINQVTPIKGHGVIFIPGGWRIPEHTRRNVRYIQDTRSGDRINRRIRGGGCDSDIRRAGALTRTIDHTKVIRI